MSSISVNQDTWGFPLNGYDIAALLGFGKGADGAVKGYQWLTESSNGWVSIGYDQEYGLEQFVPIQYLHRFLQPGAGVCYLNTAFSMSMVTPPFVLKGYSLTSLEASIWLRKCKFVNVANPSHANTLQLISERIQLDVTQAEGGRITLKSGDFCLIAQAVLPADLKRLTAEYSDEYLELAQFSFVLVQVL